MKKFILSLLFSFYIITFYSCSFPTKMQNTKPVTKEIKNTYTIAGEGGVTLSIDIEYTLAQNGYLNNGCKAQYFVTNTGKVAYNWKEQETNKIVFEFSTNDRKVIETSTSFFENLQPGKSASVMEVSISAGLNRFCTGVRAVRMEK